MVIWCYMKLKRCNHRRCGMAHRGQESVWLTLNSGRAWHHMLRAVEVRSTTTIHGKSPFVYGKIHYTWWFSIAMLVITRGYIIYHMIGTCDLRQDQTSTHQRCCSRAKQFWWTAVHGSWKWSWVTPVSPPGSKEKLHPRPSVPCLASP